MKLTDSQRRLLPPLSILLLTVIIYIPAYQARFIWDDNAIILNEQLRTLRGLFEIWFVPGSSNFEEHYWPVTYTLLWIEYQLWGVSPAGYHIVNVLLHAVNSLLVYLVLRRLHVAGAFLAALVFSSHPIHVESVAWAIEIKDVLSGCFYLSSLLFYINRQESGKRSRYILSLVCFAAGLLSKSVVITLPAAILILDWYRNRDLRKSSIAVIPYIVVGLLYVSLDLWVVRYYGQSSFHLTMHAKALIAGRAFWFYLHKLVCPYPLISIYPQWLIDTSDIRQYVFPAMVVFAGAALFLFRREIGRGIPAAFCFYLITLLPTLGFVEFSFMKYTYVADRYQYLAAAGPMALLGAAAARVGHHGLRIACQVVLVALLSAMTYAQSRHYWNVHSLFSHTLRHNPEAWPAHYALAESYFRTRANLYPLAELHYLAALDILPHHVEIYPRLGAVQEKLGKTAEAIRSYRMALQLQPTNGHARYLLSLLYIREKQYDKAEAQLRILLAQQPKLPEAYLQLGIALKQQGRSAEAREQFSEAVRLRPGFREAVEELTRAGDDTESTGTVTAIP